MHEHNRLLHAIKYYCLTILLIYYVLPSNNCLKSKATLRMKMTLEDGKSDPVAYRIKFTHHARSGDKWY